MEGIPLILLRSLNLIARYVLKGEDDRSGSECDAQVVEV